MSAKSVKLARKVAVKMTRREARTIAEAQIKELWSAPLRIRFLFALRVIFKNKGGL